MGDRIAVMNAGEIQQVAPPSEIYHDPNSLFVADFIGSPEINLFRSTYRNGNVDTGTFDVDVPDAIESQLDSELDSDEVVVGIRPEDINIVEPGEGVRNVEVQVLEPMGDTQILYFDIEGSRVRAVVQSSHNVNEGDTVGLDIYWPNVHMFHPDGPKIVKWGNVDDVDVDAESNDGVRADGHGEEA